MYKLLNKHVTIILEMWQAENDIKLDWTKSAIMICLSDSSFLNYVVYLDSVIIATFSCLEVDDNQFLISTNLRFGNTELKPIKADLQKFSSN